MPASFQRVLWSHLQARDGARRFTLLLIALLTCLCSPARAADDPPLAHLTSAQFGHAGHMQYERWAPLRITIDAVQRPFSGTLLISYPQDHTQRATLRVPAAGTPGIATPVEAVICLKSSADAVSITLLDERDRPVDRLRFGNTSEDPDAFPLIFDQREGLILCLGRITPDRIIEPLDLPPNSQDYLVYNQPQQWSPQRMAEVRAQRLITLHAVAIDPLSLPSQWAAFDTAEAIVLRTEELTDRIAPASRDAIIRWVQGGGRLVLVVDQPGDLWRTWLPTQIASLITLADPTRIPVPPIFSDVLTVPDRMSVQASRDLERLGQMPRPDPGVPLNPPTPPPATDLPEANIITPPANAQADPPSSTSPGLFSNTEKLKLFSAAFTPAESIPARPIQLHPALRSGGWQTSAAPDQPTLLAHGPVGLGYVTILTADPYLAAADPSVEPARRAWLATLTPGLQDWLSLPVQPNSMRQQWAMWNQGSSGSNDLQRQAIITALNHIAERPGRTLNPIAILIALLACALLLAILLGPVDGLVLGIKRKLHWSWATALVWIVLISILAGFMPRLFRGDLPTMRLSRTVEDIVIDQAGPAAWRTTIHGLFAASPGQRPLFTNPADAPSGSVFRGVGVGQSWDSSPPLFAPLALTQGTTLSPRGSETSVWPLPIQQGQWALRNLLSVGPISITEDRSPIRARVIRTAPQELRVEMDGLSEAEKAGCRVSSITLRHASTRDFYIIDPPAAGQSESTFTSAVGIGSTIPAYTDPVTSSTIDWSPFVIAADRSSRRTFGDYQDAPGVQRHELAFESRLATGRWALIIIDCITESSSPPDQEHAIASHQRTIRLLVPIEGSATPIDRATP